MYSDNANPMMTLSTWCITSLKIKHAGFDYLNILHLNSRYELLFSFTRCEYSEDIIFCEIVCRKF